MSLMDADGLVKMVKVSSVLNRDGKNFGRQFLTDRSEETCWNSDQGSPQWISVDFTQPVHVEKISIMFQGGFAGQTCQVMVQEASSGETDSKSLWEEVTKVYPDDVNSTQDFDVRDAIGSRSITSLRLIFQTSYDTYGRIIVYDFNLYGTRA
ncbi:hypothetical protein BC829DRAFT_399463 [Chytridium lagenaria]|nr:hypothetical protein BC829DRAFT_399463 [Chytridium lagenaria]